MSPTVEDIERALEDTKHSEYEDEYETGWGLWEDEYYASARVYDTELLPDVTVVDTKIGTEGGGEYIYIVFKIGDRHFKKEGYYASYDGSNWDGDFQEVTPIERTVVFYE